MASVLRKFQLEKRTNNLGSFLKEQRLKAKKSLGNVQKDTELTRGYISMIENGKLPINDLRKILFFSKYYKVNYMKLLKLYMEDKQYEWNI